ncbi:UNVERIFIED_CONTAM: hypothetical protein FKN15_001504 [Acipenser sinensis]
METGAGTSGPRTNRAAAGVTEMGEVKRSPAVSAARARGGGAAAARAQRGGAAAARAQRRGAAASGAQRGGTAASGAQRGGAAASGAQRGGAAASGAQGGGEEDTSTTAPTTTPENQSGARWCSPLPRRRGSPAGMPRPPSAGPDSRVAALTGTVACLVPYSAAPEGMDSELLWRGQFIGSPDCVCYPFGHPLLRQGFTMGLRLSADNTSSLTCFVKVIASKQSIER